MFPDSLLNRLWCYRLTDEQLNCRILPPSLSVSRWEGGDPLSPSLRCSACRQWGRILQLAPPLPSSRWFSRCGWRTPRGRQRVTFLQPRTVRETQARTPAARHSTQSLVINAMYFWGIGSTQHLARISVGPFVFIYKRSEGKVYSGTVHMNNSVS